jgi:hypothetical protein
VKVSVKSIEIMQSEEQRENKMKENEETQRNMRHH